MKLLTRYTTLFVAIGLLQLVACSPLHTDDLQIDASNIDSLIHYRTARSEQIDDPQKPIVDVPISSSKEPEAPVRQTEQQQTVQQQTQQQEEIPSKQQQTQPDAPSATDSVSTGGNSASAGAGESGRTEEERNRLNNNLISTTTCSTCAGVSKVKPDYSKAIATAVKGNAIAAAATLGAASPVLIKSAKVAALASLIPVKLAAKGAIIGTLIAKPIIIKSAIVSAIATKISHLLVGKPIAIGANLLAGIEALKAKAKAKKTKCVSSTCTTITSAGVSSDSSSSDSSSGTTSDVSSGTSTSTSSGTSSSGPGLTSGIAASIQPEKLTSSLSAETKLQ